MTSLIALLLAGRCLAASHKAPPAQLAPTVQILSSLSIQPALSPQGFLVPATVRDSELGLAAGLALPRPISVPPPAEAPVIVAGAAVMAMDALREGERSLAGIEKAAPDEAPAQAGRSFDGSARPEFLPSGGEGASGLPAYLSVADPYGRRWLAGVVDQAMRSKTARRLLRDVERLVAQRGYPVTVIVSRTSARGEYYYYHYDWEIVGVKRTGVKDMWPASALIHELVHVLQKAKGLPSEAFEMELEAYMIDFRVSRELGYEPERGTYYYRAQRQFKKGLPDFIKWLKKEYPDNIALAGSSLEEYEARLVEWAEAMERRIRKLEKDRAFRSAVWHAMGTNGQPAESREAYRLDEIVPIEARLRDERTALAWFQRDLELLRSPEGRKRYARFARNVMRKARAYQRTF